MAGEIGDIVGSVLGAAALLGALTLGPIDCSRSTYNTFVGDGPAMKTALVEYARKNVRHKNPDNPQKVEEDIARRLGLSYGNDRFADGRRVDPNDVSIERLWDVSEEAADNFHEKYVWPGLF